MKLKHNQVVYFQPKNIDKRYCEVGFHMEKDYLYYLDEPCKIHISEVEIIPDDKVIFDKKEQLYLIR